jgi:hypothetical protein
LNGGVSDELFLYGEEFNGVIWNVVVNRTDASYSSLYLTGDFDTVEKSSQVQLCSVSKFDGKNVVKV